MAYELVVIGTSVGGLQAMIGLFENLPAAFPLPIVVVQHRSVDLGGVELGEALEPFSALPVREVDDKDPLVPGAVHLGPADYHVMVGRTGVQLSVDEPVRFSRPSIDVLFESAADEYGEHVMAVLLTGANADGTEGLRRVRAAGGHAIVQDPASAERPEMPAAAVRAGVADEVLDLRGIAEALAARCGQPSRRRAAS
jgi:two-component system, chemotaxis family, protein-glutamate methylesterase/glutaminase